MKVETEKTPKKYIKATCANGWLKDAECSSTKETDDDEETVVEVEPDAPTGFSLTNPTTTSIQLSWSAGSENTESFVLERKLPYGDWTQIASLDAATLSYTDTTRALGVNLSYRLKAINETGASSYTDLVTGSAVFAPSLAYTFQGPHGSLLGNSVASAGDVDGDGKDDVIVGAYEYDVHFLNDPMRGRVYVYSGATGAPIYTITGAEDLARLGTSVSSAGDVDGDGRADFIAGEPYADAGGSDRGNAYVYSGATGNVLHTFTGTDNNGYLGSSVAAAGDINKDGFDDFLVGERGAAAGGTARGKAYVYSGATWTALYTFQGTEDNEYLGGVASAGDVNGDGTPDFSINSSPDSAGSNRGKVVVYSGATGTALYTLSGTENDAYFGGGKSAGDVNKDGKGDFLISAAYASGGGTERGTVYVYSGATGTVLYTINGTQDEANFGSSIDGIGDANGDGYDDFLVGENNYDLGIFDEGRAHVYSGATGTLLYTIDGTEMLAEFGISVAAAGDVNGDGKTDFIVGAWQADGAGSSLGGDAFLYLAP